MIWPKKYCKNNTPLWRERYDGWNCAIDACKSTFEKQGKLDDQELNLEIRNAVDSACEYLGAQGNNNNDYDRQVITNYVAKAMKRFGVPEGTK